MEHQWLRRKPSAEREEIDSEQQRCEAEKLFIRCVEHCEADASDQDENNEMLYHTFVLVTRAGTEGRKRDGILDEHYAGHGGAENDGERADAAPEKSCGSGGNKQIREVLQGIPPKRNSRMGDNCNNQYLKTAKERDHPGEVAGLGVEYGKYQHQ